MVSDYSSHTKLNVKISQQVAIFGVILPLYEGKRWVKMLTNSFGRAGGGGGGQIGQLFPSFFYAFLHPTYASFVTLFLTRSRRRRNRRQKYWKRRSLEMLVLLSAPCWLACDTEVAIIVATVATPTVAQHETNILHSIPNICTLHCSFNSCCLIALPAFLSGKIWRGELFTGRGAQHCNNWQKMWRRANKHIFMLFKGNRSRIPIRVQQLYVWPPSTLQYCKYWQ